MEIKINHISLIASCQSNILSDKCPICQENITSKCATCGQSSNDIICFSVLGKCGHAYHKCCIDKEMQNKSELNRKCPLCCQHWEYMRRKTRTSEPEISIAQQVEQKPIEIADDVD